MEIAAGSNLSMLSFLEFVVSLLPFQVKKFGLRHPGYLQIPKLFLLKVRFKSKKSRPPPSRKISCFLAGAVAVLLLLHYYYHLYHQTATAAAAALPPPPPHPPTPAHAPTPAPTRYSKPYAQP